MKSREVIFVFIAVLASLTHQVSGQKSRCEMFLGATGKRKCDIQDPPGDSVRNLSYGHSPDRLPNLPLINAAHCDVNTGICKMLSGRFEFQYDLNKEEVLGPIGKQNYVRASGIHERVPLSYTPDGDVLTADRVINWATLVYTKDKIELNLMDTKQFNWCKYAGTNNWPYKSGFYDHKRNKLFKIYFSNRQSCILNVTDNAIQHFNTRFLYNSSLRIDLDYNPTIFPFRDPLNKDIRLIKHHRQHWYEVGYELLVRPTSELKYFVRMDQNEVAPSKVNGSSGPFLVKSSYQKFNSKKDKVCLTDYYQSRAGKNGKLLQTSCGFDLNEIVDKPSTAGLITVSLHTIPRFPREAEHFFGVDVDDDNEWTVFAKDGVSFSAMTTRSRTFNQHEVFILYSKYTKEPSTKFSESYPEPYLSRYTARWTGSDWVPNIGERDRNARQQATLNYVDDIAYLHKCKNKILVIFGPLYQEIDSDSFFDLNKRYPVGSIVNLGLYETTNAFTEDPGEPGILYFYHGVNWVAKHKHTCQRNDRGLLLATKQGSYKRYAGAYDERFPTFSASGEFGPRGFSPEAFFKTLGVFDDNIPADAPNPADFPYDYAELEYEARDLSWLYYLVAAVAAIVIILAAICLFVTRRRKKPVRRPKGIGMMRTHRSSSVTSSTGPNTLTRRSGSGRSSSRSTATQRSGIKRPSSLSRSGGINKTRRSSMTSGSNRSARSQ